MNGNLPEDTRTTIENSLLAGRKIEAIKLYRKHTGSDLAQAKNAVEDMEVRLRRISPEKFIAGPPAKGCGATALVMAVIIVILLALLILSIGSRMQS